jgi:hypothetical protein
MVSVLAITQNVLGFKPGRDDTFLKTTAIRSALSFGGEAKPEAQCCNILQHAKINCNYEQKCRVWSSTFFPSPVTPAFYQMTAGRIAI